MIKTELPNRIISRQLKMPGFIFYRDYCYPENSLEKGYAIREKLILHEGSFKWLKNYLAQEDFLKLFSFFKIAEESMKDIENQVFENNLKDHINQLLLIRYSHCSDRYSPFLHQLGSSIFGRIHEDEVCCSLHFGETSNELRVFDYYDSKWKSFPNSGNTAQILLGQYARSYGFFPTPHKLEANTLEKTKERFSFILEKVSPLFKAPFSYESPEFSKLTFNHKRKQTAFLIWDKNTTGDVCFEDLYQLTFDLISCHFYFWLDGSEEKIFRFDSNKDQFTEIESKGFEYVVCIHPGFMIQSDNEAEELLSLATACPEKFFIRYQVHQNLTGLSLCHLKNGRGELIDKLIKRKGVLGTQNYLPHELVQNIKCRIFSFQVTDSSKVIDWSSVILEERKSLEKNLKRGFETVFVFNTESYKDIGNIRDDIKPKQIIGFPSGFKLIFLYQKFKDHVDEILFVDSNQNALSLKKAMIESWDGDDFSHWFSDYYDKSFPIFPISKKDSNLIKACWEKELEAWGGAESFKDHWQDFMKVSVKFKKLDLIDETENFCNMIDAQNNVIMWCSNMWKNEFIDYKIGTKNLTKKCLEWIQKLGRHNPNCHILGDIPVENKTFIRSHGLSVSEILKNFTVKE